MVVGHGGLGSDSGGNGAPLWRRRKTASTWTLGLSGEVDELQRMMMESWASWKQCFHEGEGARRRRVLGGNGGAGALLLLRAEEVKENGKLKCERGGVT